jgi:hypothetical protein
MRASEIILKKQGKEQKKTRYTSSDASSDGMFFVASAFP